MKKTCFLLGMLLFFFVLASCASSKAAILPETSQIQDIEIIDLKSNQHVTISNNEEITKLVEMISSQSASINQESVNDQPTNVDFYITLKFDLRNALDESHVYYVYQKKNRFYFEEPYAHVYTISKTVYELIVSYCASDTTNQ